MKNLLKWTAFLLVATLMFQSCDDDGDPEPTPLPDATGMWILSKATLVNGKTGSDPAEDLVVSNVLGAGPATVEIGDFAQTTALITGFLANAACDEVSDNPTGYFLELASEGENNLLYFGCVDATGITKEEAGSWKVAENSDGTYTMTLVVAVADAQLPIYFNDFEVADGKALFSGTVVGFPYVIDGLYPIADPIPPDNVTNLQFIDADMEFVPAQ